MLRRLSSLTDDGLDTVALYLDVWTGEHSMTMTFTNAEGTSPRSGTVYSHQCLWIFPIYIFLSFIRLLIKKVSVLNHGQLCKVNNDLVNYPLRYYVQWCLGKNV